MPLLTLYLLTTCYIWTQSHDKFVSLLDPLLTNKVSQYSLFHWMRETFPLTPGHESCTNRLANMASGAHSWSSSNDRKCEFAKSELWSVQFSSVQSLSCVRLFVTPWIAACQASLSITISQSSLRLTSIKSVMPSSHLILGHPILLPPIPPSIRVFSNESAVFIRWPKYWSFSISPSNEYSGLISFRIDWFDLLAVQGTLKSLLQHHSSNASNSTALRCIKIIIIFLLATLALINLNSKSCHHSSPACLSTFTFWVIYSYLKHKAAFSDGSHLLHPAYELCCQSHFIRIIEVLWEIPMALCQMISSPSSWKKSQERLICWFKT